MGNRRHHNDMANKGAGLRTARFFSGAWETSEPEIRACLEAEVLTDVQQRLVLLSRDMDTHNGQRISHQPAFTGR